VYHASFIFIWSPIRLIPLLAPVQTGTVKGRVLPFLSWLLLSFCSLVAYFLTPRSPPSHYSSLVKTWQPFPLLLRCLVKPQEEEKIWSTAVLRSFLKTWEEYVFIMVSVRQIFINYLPSAKHSFRPEIKSNQQGKISASIKYIFSKEDTKLKHRNNDIPWDVSEKARSSGRNWEGRCNALHVSGKCSFWVIYQGRPLGKVSWKVDVNGKRIQPYTATRAMRKTGVQAFEYKAGKRVREQKDNLLEGGTWYRKWQTPRKAQRAVWPWRTWAVV
jgi:hypothetical protein